MSLYLLLIFHDLWELQKDTAYCFENNLERSTLQNSSCMTIYLPSQKSSKNDEQDMLEM